MPTQHDAFISYSRRSDADLAAAFERGLEALARPLLKLRALDVFRDRSELTGPLLWPAIVEHLEGARWFLLFASTASAESQWCSEELQWWLDKHGTERLLILWTDGEIAWDRSKADFDWQRTTALARRLQGSFPAEPLFTDLRWARDGGELGLRNPRFREAVVDVAAPLRGMRKDELDSADLRQLARNRWLVRAGVSAIVVAAVIATWQAIVAREQSKVAQAERDKAVAAQKEAERQRDAALSQSLAVQSALTREQFADRLPLAVLLALESLHLNNSIEGQQALRASLALLPHLHWSATHPDPQRGRVRALAYSPDGRWLAAAHDDGSARLVDLRSGKLAATLAHDADPGAIATSSGGTSSRQAAAADQEVVSVAFSSDGKLLATGSNDNTARLWDVATGRTLLTLPHDAPVSAVAFHPLRPLLATAGRDGNVIWWDIPSRRVAGRYTHREEARAIAFSPDGQRLASLSTDGCLRVHNLASERPPAPWCDGMSGLDLAFSADSKRVGVARGDHAAVIDAGSGRVVFQATHLDGANPDSDSHLRWIDAVAFSPDGAALASAGRDGTARLWNIAKAQEMLRLQHAAPVGAVAFSADGAFVASASVDGTARLWDARSGRELLRSTHSGGAETVAFSRDGRLVASGGTQGDIAVWGTARGDQTATLRHEADVNAVASSGDGRFVATADAKGMVRLWSTHGELLATQGPVFGARRLSFSHDSRFVIALGAGSAVAVFEVEVDRQLAARAFPRLRSGGDAIVSQHHIAWWDRERRQLRIWDSAGGDELPAFDAERAYRIGFDTTGAALWVSHEAPRGGGEIVVHRLPGREEIGRVAFTQRPEVALAAGGSKLALSGLEVSADRQAPRHHVDLWSLPGSKPATRIALAAGINSMAFDPTGRTLVTIGEDGELRSWNAETGAPIARLQPDDDVAAMRFHPDAPLLALAIGKTMLLWNHASGETLASVPLEGRIRTFSFSSDGQSLLTVVHGGPVALWSWRPADLRAEACRRLPRNLAPDEWRRHFGDAPYRATCAQLPAAPQPMR